MAITAPDEQTIDPEHNEKLLNSPELPPRIDTLPRPRAPSLQERNVFATLLKNYKQVTSLTAGKPFWLNNDQSSIYSFHKYTNNNNNNKKIIHLVSDFKRE